MDSGIELLQCAKCTKDLNKIYREVCNKMFGEDYHSMTFKVDGEMKSFRDDVLLEYYKFYKGLEVLVYEIIVSCVKMMFEYNITMGAIDAYRRQLHNSDEPVGPGIIENKNGYTVLDRCLYIIDCSMKCIHDMVEAVIYSKCSGYLNKKIRKEGYHVIGGLYGIEACVLRIFLSTTFRVKTPLVYNQVPMGTVMFNREIEETGCGKVQYRFVISDDLRCSSFFVKRDWLEKGYVIAITNISDTFDLVKFNNTSKVYHLSHYHYFLTKYAKYISEIPKIYKNKKGEVGLYQNPPICRCAINFNSRARHDLVYLMDENVIDSTFEDCCNTYENRHVEGYDIDNDDNGYQFCDACDEAADRVGVPYNQVNSAIVKKNYLINDGHLINELPCLGSRILFHDDEMLFKCIKKFYSGKLHCENIVTGMCYTGYYVMNYISKLAFVLRPPNFSSNIQRKCDTLYRNFYGCNSRLLHHPLRGGRDVIIDHYPPPDYE